MAGAKPGAVLWTIHATTTTAAATTATTTPALLDPAGPTGGNAGRRRLDGPGRHRQPLERERDSRGNGQDLGGVWGRDSRNELLHDRDEVLLCGGQPIRETKDDQGPVSLCQQGLDPSPSGRSRNGQLCAPSLRRKRSRSVHSHHESRYILLAQCLSLRNGGTVQPGSHRRRHLQVLPHANRGSPRHPGLPLRDADRHSLPGHFLLHRLQVPGTHHLHAVRNPIQVPGMGDL
mmetsp:Transcript_16580/g.45665  ORF Transcript_16580/g.45665 Transcript_16580/m.45665 type:complete len:232 (-) Transcript_16580:638-1333(-)